MFLDDKTFCPHRQAIWIAYAPSYGLLVTEYIFLVVPNKIHQCPYALKSGDALCGLEIWFHLCFCGLESYATNGLSHGYGLLTRVAVDGCCLLVSGPLVSRNNQQVWIRLAISWFWCGNILFTPRSHVVTDGTLVSPGVVHFTHLRVVKEVRT
jgi:hypothetical protein